jgi:hypothetical protein
MSSVATTQACPPPARLLNLVTRFCPSDHGPLQHSFVSWFPFYLIPFPVLGEKHEREELITIKRSLQLPLRIELEHLSNSILAFLSHSSELLSKAKAFQRNMDSDSQRRCQYQAARKTKFTLECILLSAQMLSCCSNRPIICRFHSSAVTRGADYPALFRYVSFRLVVS